MVMPMKMPMKVVLISALLICCGTAAMANPSRQQPEVGQPFGPLVLPTVNGSQVIDLASFHGRKVLLIEFASW